MSERSEAIKIVDVEFVPVQQEGRDELLERKLALAMEAVAIEFRRAITLHGPMRSPHEGFGVLTEEWDEYKDAIRANSMANQAEELTQIAAVALRNLVDTISLPVLEANQADFDARKQVADRRAAVRRVA